MLKASLDAPGSTAMALALAVGLSHVSTRQALQILRDRGLVASRINRGSTVHWEPVSAAKPKEVPRGPVPP